MFDTILFDFDGTICDTGLGIMNCAKYAIEEAGYEVRGFESLRSFVGPPLLQVLMEYTGADEEQGRAMLEKYRERYHGPGLLENEIYPGMKDMLLRLKAEGKRLAIASAKPTVFVEKILQQHGVDGCFEVILGATLDNSRTTKIAIMEETLRLLGLSEAEKSRTVMVGDRFYDVEGARHFGLDCVGVTYGYEKPGELAAAGARWLARNVPELEKILLG